MIDIHAHVLPGLDDGPANMGDALALVRAAAEDGIHTVVATPHMLDGVYDASRDDVFAGVAALNDTLQEHGIAVSVLAGADVHAETEIPDLLRDGKLVTIADRGKHLLMELPPDVVPAALDQLLFHVQLRGVRPIISHPERNRVIQENPDELYPLIRAGSLAQVTAASVLGDFGSQVQGCARALFERRMAHFLGTDMHGMGRRGPKLSAAASRLREWMDAEDAQEIVSENPDAVIHGRPVNAPEAVPPRPRKRWLFR